MTTITAQLPDCQHDWKILVGRHGDRGMVVLRCPKCALEIHVLPQMISVRLEGKTLRALDLKPE